ncbi:DUF1844 domain-containing protein [bacterium]|nr:DUF1844 domain-containing protein [bacterium]
MSAGDERDVHFLGLVFSLHAAAMQQLGKLVSPLSGQTERDLGAARQTIDLLESLSRKTRGNLSRDEERALQDILTQLRLNYVDERKKGETTPAPDAATEAPRAASDSAD